MSESNGANNFPKLHNAAWPGVVGKGPDSEPPIDLDIMLDLTAAAEVNGQKFEGTDLFLSDPHVSIDLSDDGLKQLADKVQSRNLVVGSVVAPVWPTTGGGSSAGDEAERSKFVKQVRKAAGIAKKLRELGVRPYGVIRIDSAVDVASWAADPEANTAKIAETFKESCKIAADYGETLAAEGEICWGGMHSWKEMVNLLEAVGQPETLGFQADMAHTLLYTLGYNAPEDRILPEDFSWEQNDVLQDALKTLTNALRPWTTDFHVAQNDATVKGSGSHDKTGRHCLPEDPNGKLFIAQDAGHWLRNENGELTKKCRHICWDGCMFPNDVMMKPETWNNILAAMVSVRESHGWSE
ncbi:MAG: hypothetical protein M2R45_00350 [Verrucomicrobia subdivision 3 bacterium]|nr:hypothetical protein [Limisphaerales bacterium]MCS1412892.1 hypothetical protein [Limisphaerales bacterium]